MEHSRTTAHEIGRLCINGDVAIVACSLAFLCLSSEHYCVMLHISIEVFYWAGPCNQWHSHTQCLCVLHGGRCKVLRFSAIRGRMPMSCAWEIEDEMTGVESLICIQTSVCSVKSAHEVRTHQFYTLTHQGKGVQPFITLMFPTVMNTSTSQAQQPNQVY